MVVVFIILFLFRFFLLACFIYHTFTRAASKTFHSHPIGNRLKAIDFIGGFELHGSKKRLIPSHSTKKRQKRPIFEGFCGIPVG
jgi:hypothetical protein